MLIYRSPSPGIPHTLERTAPIDLRSPADTRIVLWYAEHWSLRAKHDIIPRVVTGTTIALVGGVGGGKTSIAQYLATQHGFCTVPDYMQYLSTEERRTFYNSSPANRLRRLLDIEGERYQSVLMFTPESPVALDRSMFCILAHEYAMRNLQPEYVCPFDIADSRSLYPMPVNLLCVLDTNQPTRLARCQRRGSVMPAVFLSPEYNSLLLQYYHKLRSIIDILFIDTTDRTVQVTAHELLSAASHLGPRDFAPAQRQAVTLALGACSDGG